MQERDYPKFVSFPHHSQDPYCSTSNPVRTPEAWAERLAEMDPAHVADIQRAIEEAAELHSDVHLYRRRGSQFLGIGFEYSNGSAVKVLEYPES